MTPESVVEIAQYAMRTVVFVAGPMLVSGMVVGLIISIFQAATQINEMTMTFVPKIVAVLATGVLFLPWIMANLVRFTHEIFARISAIGVS